MDRRLREELARLDLRLNEAKSRIVDLGQGGGVWIPGLRRPARPLMVGALAATVHAHADPADGVAVITLAVKRTGKRRTGNPVRAV